MKNNGKYIFKFVLSFRFQHKKSEKFIHQDIENRVWSYLGGIARKHKLTALQIGGIENHIHALIIAPPVVAPSQIAKWLKGDSSKWIHEEFTDLQRFAWQDGFGVFSVSKSSAPKVVEYIKNQRQHHLNQSFEDEYIELLKLHGIEYNEKYLFD
jgi:REP element-mobilizing transposase RayT